MSLNPRFLADHVIRPTLTCIGMNSPAAVKLLLGTCAAESHMGAHRLQIGGGPARGIYQMEPATEADIWATYLNRPDKANLRKLVHIIAGTIDPWETNCIVYNDFYATAMARIHYWRDPEPLPAAVAAPELAACWKRVYNTPLGAGTVNHFLAQWQVWNLDDLSKWGENLIA